MSQAPPLRLGTRKSPMALAQSRQVAQLITELTGRQVELTPITTLGDVSKAQLTQIGGTGVTRVDHGQQSRPTLLVEAEDLEFDS